MLTLHVEAETVAELVKKVLAALGIDGTADLTTEVTREAVAEVVTPESVAAPYMETPPKPKRKAKADSVVTFPTIETDEQLRKQFEVLVERNYEGALSILDTLGVANFKEAVTKGMAPQIKLAMEAFA